MATKSSAKPTAPGPKPDIPPAAMTTSSLITGLHTVPARHNGHTPAPRPTMAERQARARALREQVPLISHAFWAESSDRPDPISLLEAQATVRQPHLIPIRHARMRVSPFAFFRGSDIMMADDLSHTPISGLTAQLCGDCHLSNFGLYASPERDLLFDINDFDETIPGPWEWDVKRLAASFHVAGRNNGFSEVACRDAVLTAVRSYRIHMAEYALMRDIDIWYARVTADDLRELFAKKRIQKSIQKMLGKARRRDHLQAFAKLTEMVNGQRIIANDPPFVMRVTEEQLGFQIDAIYNSYAQTLRGAQRNVFERYHVVDIALKVVGVGSVGTWCYIVLLIGRDADDPLLIQIKQAGDSVLQPYLPRCAFEHQGERVVWGQELMQANSDIFLGWITGPVSGREFYLRQLRDMKGAAEVEALTPSEMNVYADACGWALARAHARSGDEVQIAAYLGNSNTFDLAIAIFAEAYANQTERDYRTMLAAIKSGRIVAATEGVS
ncbi:MAG: hypothetical protein OJF49_004168 [Ktedonobacterales bacterium]|jgi:uncharacterized protein (DUF2252 family)|nr:MAG: hypothetical protein OJF49_004168 [Ktedonobacterales bacterium]